MLVYTLLVYHLVINYCSNSYQSTGLYACCKRYGDFSFNNRFAVLFPSLSWELAIMFCCLSLQRTGEEFNHKSFFNSAFFLLTSTRDGLDRQWELNLRVFSKHEPRNRTTEMQTRYRKECIMITFFYAHGIHRWTSRSHRKIPVISHR